MSHIQISLNSTGTGSVLVDGVDLSKAVRGITLDTTARSQPTISLALMIEHLDVDADAVIRLSPWTEAALRALGWTPAEAAS